MPSVLVLYGTGEGQTAKVASQIAETLDGRGHDATSIDIENRPDEFALASFDAVLIGSSIHVGAHDKQIREFVSANRDELQRLPTGFLHTVGCNISKIIRHPWVANIFRYLQPTVSGVALVGCRRPGATRRGGELRRHAARRDRLAPRRIGLFGGALRYSKYGFLKRLMMKRIAKGATGDVDTSQDYEYTDWAEVDAFASDFAAFVEGRLDTEADAGES
jgi:menaquinone-dependent protoporphyrinogen oxidase